MAKRCEYVSRIAVVTVIALSSPGLLLRAQQPQPVGSWAPLAVVSDARSGAASVVLDDGRTLVLGGHLADGTVTESVVAFEPATGTFATAGQMLARRVGHTATLLDDGRVLVAGGTVEGTIDAGIEVFDPATGVVTAQASMTRPRTEHAAARLTDGSVLIVGGVTAVAAEDGGVATFATATAEIVDPSSATATALSAAMQVARAGASATTLIDGRVLVAGGRSGATDLASAEIFEPQSGMTFVPADSQLSVARSGHTAVLLPHNNSVLMAGGRAAGLPVTTTDLFLPAEFPDPYTYGMGRFAAASGMATPRAGAVGGPGSTDGFAYVMGGGPEDAERYRFATIRTDQDDYAPGERAVITGTGWQPGETVRLLFQEDPAVHDDYVLDVVVDGEGNLFWDQWAPENHDVGVRFYLMATGSISKAQTTFTDGNLFSTIAFGIGPSPVAPGATLTWNLTAVCRSVGANTCVSEGFTDGGFVQDGYPVVIQQATNATFTSGVTTRQSATTTGGAANGSFTAPASGGPFFYRARHSNTNLPNMPVAGNATNSWQPEDSNSVTVTLVVDATPPVITPTITGTLGNNGWYTSDVGLTWTVSDPQSAVTTSTGCGSNSVTADTSGVTFTCSATSGGGTTSASVTIKRDATAPSISASRTPAANGAGWNNTNVVASYTASDTLAGLDGSSPETGDFTFATDGANQTHTFTVTDLAGNGASATVANVNIDKTAPSVSATPSPAANGNGWNNTDVTVSFSCVETGAVQSGVVASTVGEVTLSTEGANQSATNPSACADVAGNTASATVSGINIDKTAPSISASRTPEANAAGWNNTAVVASYAASDALSGLDGSSPANGDFSFTADGTNLSHTFTVTDQAGNSASATVANVNIDTTAPSVSATPSPAANGNGWNNSNVTVSFSCVETGAVQSGVVASNVGEVTLSTEGANQSATNPASCADVAGNTASSTLSGINIDKTAPSISASRTPAANSAGWNNTDVVASYTASDTLAGLNGSSSATGTFLFATEGPNQSHTFTVTDQAGNSASASVTGVNIDKTAPTLVPVVTPNPVLLGGTATATPNASDALSGVVTETCPVVDTSSVGPKSLSCTATDKAGNTGSAPVSYSVRFDWRGFLQPINDTAHQIGATQSVFKLGQTIPAKFILRDAAGASAQQTPNPTFLRTGNLGSCAVAASLDTAEPVTPDVVPEYRWDGLQYHYNWSTKGLTAGVYRIYAVLADGTQPWVDICLRK